MIHQQEWFELKSPPLDWVRQVKDVPGFKWVMGASGVEAVKFHRTHTPLIPGLLLDSRLSSVSDDAWNGVALSRSNASMRNVVLRSYQKEDLPFLWSRSASILGYEMRLGKTCTATSVHNPSDGPLVIVGPLVARDVWRDWCEKLHGFSPVALESRRNVPLSGYPAYFIHYDILDSHTAFLYDLQPATVIFDEIHLLQARRSQRISACSLLASRASRIIGLSGTPMWSNPRSLWPILNLLSPGAWGTEFDFAQRYTNASRGPYGWKYDGTRNEQELKSRLNEVVVRRTWKDVLGQLPPTTNVVELVSLDKPERHKVEVNAQKAYLAAGNGVAAGYHATLRRMFGGLKVKRAMELAWDAMRSGHKVVLWTWHKEVADSLVKELNGANARVYQINAEQSQNDREANRLHFQMCISPCAMVSALAVGGVAIDLNSADINIFVELDWIPATLYQASMRTFKPGRPQSNVWMVCDTDVERRLVEVLGCNESCQSAAGLGYEEVAAKIFVDKEI